MVEFSRSDNPLQSPLLQVQGRDEVGIKDFNCVGVCKICSLFNLSTGLNSVDLLDPGNSFRVEEG